MSKSKKRRASRSSSKKNTSESADDALVDDIETEADGVRRKYKYRKLVMRQGLKLPARLAMKMVGPDCAFHLYSQHMPKE